MNQLFVNSVCVYSVVSGDSKVIDEVTNALYFLVNLIERLKELCTLYPLTSFSSSGVGECVCMQVRGDYGPRFPCRWSWEPGNEAALYTVLSLVN